MIRRRIDRLFHTRLAYTRIHGMLLMPSTSQQQWTPKDRKAPSYDQLMRTANTPSTKREIESLAQAELAQSAYPPVREVSCEYRDGVLTLHGRVFSYFQKQIAQAVVMHRLEGVATIENRVDVDYP